MRVTSGFWVAAYIRRVFAEGAFAAVVRRGAEEAGAIFVAIDWLDGTVDLYGPAPQTVFDDSRPTDRLFTRIGERIDRLELQQRIASETRFDPDIWLVETEDRQGRSFLDIAAG
ncbi:MULTISPECIES: DUF1491 family protein [Kaistia]|uniref:DUF1491 family protein n=1 Tax=Kaistia nematophila TaxID=2994654 RepID=A0A9X3IMU1_9HYPH|nr:DUF1491 family protein [Kaistia nematophila]MBN9059937.1 DUF1491 family protein [Hyphomicrobiales bacterium]MCX5572179.1 DUF1491 family protein [Kaistia nematophila]